jgi:hypothetical protein
MLGTPQVSSSDPECNQDQARLFAVGRSSLPQGRGPCRAADRPGPFLARYDAELSEVLAIVRAVSYRDTHAHIEGAAVADMTGGVGPGGGADSGDVVSLEPEPTEEEPEAPEEEPEAPEEEPAEEPEAPAEEPGPAVEPAVHPSLW